MELEDKLKTSAVEAGGFAVEKDQVLEIPVNTTEQMAAPDFGKTAEVIENDESLSSVQDLGSIDQSATVGNETAVVEQNIAEQVSPEVAKKRFLGILNGDEAIPVQGGKMGTIYGELMGYSADHNNSLE